MASEFDASEFVDDDLHAARQRNAPSAGHAATAVATDPTAPGREDVDAKVGQMQQKLAELKRAQQELERERASLEETRRRQVEFTTGREEMLHHLTRGLGLMEEAEFAARRDAEQMGKVLAGLRDAMTKVQGIQEETWTKDNLQVELTRASTIIENARMEWNAARLKFPVLSGGPAPAANELPPNTVPNMENLLREQNYAEICKLGLALTWPIALAALAIFLVLLLP